MGLYLRDNRDKAEYHLERAEYWQSEVDGFERWALRQVATQEEGRMQRGDGSRLDLDYLAGKWLENKHSYKAAIANRNAHQRQAEIYFLAAIAGARVTPWVRTDEGLKYVSLDPK